MLIFMLLDENYFYHNIHNVENFLKYDPFLNKMPEAT